MILGFIFVSGQQPSGWRTVPVHDPVVQDAAHHAVKTIQQRSNSLFPYELTEVVHANAEVGISECINWLIDS